MTRFLDRGAPKFPNVASAFAGTLEYRSGKNTVGARRFIQVLRSPNEGDAWRFTASISRRQFITRQRVFVAVKLI